MEFIKVNSRYVTIKLTHEEVHQLDSVVGQGYGDGDHIDWIGLPESSKEVRALHTVMAKVAEASGIVLNYNKQTPFFPHQPK